MTQSRLRTAKTIGERVLKVDHSGEHGAVCIYRAQRWVATWRAPALIGEIDHFIAHEKRHRALFEAALARRSVRRCRSYHLCGLGGLALGFVTGLLGRRAIALTTQAVESVVLRHLDEQLVRLGDTDPDAAATVATIIADEQEHHDSAADKLDGTHPIDGLLRPLVRGSTEAVIWLGMRLP